MKPKFFARWALLVLVVVFFLVPFAMRGARFALQRMKNDVKDWLPADFAETKQLDWFRDHFLGEQFVLASWEGCTEDSNEFKTLYAKLTARDIPPSMRPVVDMRFGPPIAPVEKAEPSATGEVDLNENFIGDEYELFISGRNPDTGEYEFHEDWGGQGEKWLKGIGDNWFYITPAGDLYQWEGGNSLAQAIYRSGEKFLNGTNTARGELVASLGPVDGPWYHAEPRRLTAQLFRKVVTGPGVLDQLLAQVDEDEARKRLSGSLFGPDGEQTCMILTLTQVAKNNLRNVLGRGMLGRTQGVLLELAQESGINPVTDLRLGGPPVDNVAIDEEGEITLVRLVGFCLLLGVGLSYICFRSIYATMMVFFVGGVSAVTSLAIVFLSGSVMDAVLMTMPSVVYVLGLSGAVHVINYYRDAVDTDGYIGAPEKAVALSWKPCVLAALTTAVGLGSLCTSKIVPIYKFGLFSAVGVLATLILLFTYLPAALQMWPLPKRTKKHEGDQKQESGWQSALIDRFASFISRNNGWITVASIAAMIAFGYGVTKINTSVELLKMFDGNSKIIRDYTWLEENIGKLVPMEVVIRVDESMMRPHREEFDKLDESQQLEASRIQLNQLERVELAKRVHNVIEKKLGAEGRGIVGKVMSSGTFVPELPRPTARTSITRNTANLTLENSRPDLLESDYLRLDKEDGAELWRLSLRVAALDGIDYGEFVGDLQEVVEPIMAAYRHREELLRGLDKLDGTDPVYKVRKVLVLGSQTRKGDQAEDAAQEQTSRQIYRQTILSLLKGSRLQAKPGKAFKKADFETPEELIEGLNEFAAVVLVSDDTEYDAEFLKQHANLFVDARDYNLPSKADFDSPDAVSAIYTGVVPLVYKAQRTLLESLQESIGWAFVLIALVMIVLLRSPTAGLFSMLPNIFPVVIIFGAMGWVGIAVDIGSMMTASVAMGIAVDDTIHFLTWFRWGLDQGMHRRRAIRVAFHRVAPAMMQTTAIAGFGLAIFAFSTFTPTQRFGYLMLFMLVVALIGDLIFLPALLAGPVGRVFGSKRGSKRKQDGASSSSETNSSELQMSVEQQTLSPPHVPPQDTTSASSGKVRKDRPHRRLR